MTCSCSMARCSASAHSLSSKPSSQSRFPSHICSLRTQPALRHGTSPRLWDGFEILIEMLTVLEKCSVAQKALRRLRDSLSHNFIQPCLWHLCPKFVPIPGVALLSGLGEGGAEDVGEGDEVLLLETPRGVLRDNINFQHHMCGVRMFHRCNARCYDSTIGFQHKYVFNIQLQRKAFSISEAAFRACNIEHQCHNNECRRMLDELNK